MAIQKYRLIPILFILTLNNVWAMKTYRSKAENIGHKAVELELLGSTFSTTGYYDNNGTKQTLASDRSFSEQNFDGAFIYGLGKQLEIRVGGRYRQNESTNGTLSVAASGFESYYGGAKYSFKPRGKFRFAIDASFRSTTYENDTYAIPNVAPTNVIVLGDAGTEIQVGPHLSYKIGKRLHISGTGLYTMPPNELSSEVFYNLELALEFKRFALIGGVKGIYSMGEDEYGDTPTAKPTQSTGVTYRYNSINREYMAPHVGVNLNLSYVRLQFAASSITSGVYTDAGNEYTVGLIWNSSEKKREEKKITRFKEYLIEATVIKVSPRGKFVKIDQGMGHDVEKGMKFDIFQTDYFGGNVLVATGVVYQLGSDWAIIRLLKRYSEIQIKNGFTARGYD